MVPGLLFYQVQIEVSFHICQHQAIQYVNNHRHEVTHIAEKYSSLKIQGTFCEKMVRNVRC